MASPTRRITYILKDGLTEIEAGASSDGTEVFIKDTYAAKQVRVRSAQSTTTPSNVELTWSSKVFEDPFEAPGERGLRVYLDVADETPKTVQSLEAWMQSCGLVLKRQAGPILVNNTFIYYSDPNFTTKQLLETTCLEDVGLDKSDIPYALRLRLGVEGDVIEVQESSTFYYPLERTEIVQSDIRFSKTEIGIFSKLNTNDTSECFWSGRTRSLGRADTSKPVVISDTPQHVSLKASATAALSQPQGLHPDLLLSIPNVRLTSPDLIDSERCKLYVKVDLPNEVFMDLYQLQQEETAYLFEGLWGNDDLEAPVWTVDSGSTALLELNDRSDSETLEYKIPIHLRYAIPGNSEYAHSTIYPPQVFYKCPSASTTREKWDHFGFPGVFNKQATYYHLEGSAISVSIPRLQAKDGFTVTTISLGIMALSLAVILLTVFKTMGSEVAKPNLANKDKKKRD